jgi:K+-transporting ATPase ATPase C chain
VLTGVVYPLVVWGISRLAFPTQARGSLVVRDGVVVGSSLIGQPFTQDRYFHSRPSAAGAGYDAMSSSASNLGPTSRVLVSAVESRVAQATAENGGAPARGTPIDAVTASASGLDPHISPDNARTQCARVAKARGLTEQAVFRVVEQVARGRQLGILGEPRVNVLELNLALDAVSR